ncbi:DUF397 domain-containing protein [Streptomyces sp. NPDC008137]|uniref:DUF397 domain-containing protein n=1 Tax=Streptomyces sp. NPDC008137 TaxID=3364813 RepID=UPI0036F07900
MTRGPRRRDTGSTPISGGSFHLDFGSLLTCRTGAGSDSKPPNGPKLVFRAGAWVAFFVNVKDGTA